MLDFERFRTVSAWRRPGTSRDDFDEEICHIFGEAASAHRVCLAFGDFNDEPLESPLLDLGVEISAPKDGDTYLPSRWGGSRAIDWIGFNDPTLAVHSQFSEVKLGDHRLLQTTWQATFERQPRAKLRPTPVCHKPHGVGQPVWREELRCFFECEVHEGDVNQQWLQLVDLIVQAASYARGVLECEEAPCPRGARPKGSVPTVQDIAHEGRAAGRLCSESWMVQRLCRFQGQLLEVARQDNPPEALLRRLHRLWPKPEE